jgi:hypothetical protein
MSVVRLGVSKLTEEIPWFSRCFEGGTCILDLNVVVPLQSLRQGIAPAIKLTTQLFHRVEWRLLVVFDMMGISLISSRLAYYWP